MQCISLQLGDYNNKAHNLQWALQEAPNANKEVSSGCVRFNLIT